MPISSRLNLTPPKFSVLGFFEGVQFEAEQERLAAETALARSRSALLGQQTRGAATAANLGELTLGSNVALSETQASQAALDLGQDAQLFPSLLSTARSQADVLRTQALNEQRRIDAGITQSQSSANTSAALAALRRAQTGQVGVNDDLTRKKLELGVNLSEAELAAINRVNARNNQIDADYNACAAAANGDPSKLAQCERQKLLSVQANKGTNPPSASGTPDFGNINTTGVPVNKANAPAADNLTPRQIDALLNNLNNINNPKGPGN